MGLVSELDLNGHGHVRHLSLPSAEWTRSDVSTVLYIAHTFGFCQRDRLSTLICTLRPVGAKPSGDRVVKSYPMLGNAIRNPVFHCMLKLVR